MFSRTIFIVVSILVMSQISDSVAGEAELDAESGEDTISTQSSAAESGEDTILARSQDMTE